jgi:hypothetical protein
MFEAGMDRAPNPFANRLVATLGRRLDCICVLRGKADLNNAAHCFALRQLGPSMRSSTYTRFASNPAAEIDTRKNSLVMLVSVSYQHVFSGAELESEVFRFVYNLKKMNVRRAATTEADKKQARDPEIYPPPNSPN